MKNKILIFGVLILLIGLLSFAIAVIGDGVRIVSPISGSNFSTLASTLFNVSFVNGTDITNPANATFYLNIGGVWTIVGSTAASGGCQVGGSASSCAVSLTNSTIPDGTYSLNATIYNSTNSVSATSSSNLSTIIIDTARPVVFSTNITNPSNFGNYSQILLLNASIIDSLSGVGTVLFNITNSNNQQNSSLAASREGSGSSYSVSINTTHYPDGYYNITIYANDT